MLRFISLVVAGARRPWLVAAIVLRSRGMPRHVVRNVARR